MRARITWYPVANGRARSSVVEVTPDELATLRSALSLPPESLAAATARIRTYSERGSVRSVSYPLRAVSSIKPFRLLPRHGRDAASEERKEDEEKSG